MKALRRGSPFTRRSFSPFALRRAASLLLAITIFAVQTPAAPRVLGETAAQVQNSLGFWLRTSEAVAGLGEFFSRQKAEPQEAQEARDTRVARVQLFPGDMRVHVGEQVTFAAVAFDDDDVPVGGVKFNWGSSDGPQDLHMRETGTGEFHATMPGSYQVTAEGAGQSASATIVVMGGERGKVEADEATLQALPAGDPYGWNDQNLRAAFEPGNERGEPQDSSDTDAGAGSGNFNFSVPVLSLPGRGSKLELSLVYNSRVWNKDKAHNEMAFNIDRDWPAPGWSLGFGKMINTVGGGAMLIEADGTRHDYFQGSLQVLDASGSTAFVGQTKDGSFINYRCETFKSGGVVTSTKAVASYPNGTVIGYASAETVDGTYILYPTTITDVNGNIITITYRNGVGPRIQTITDTLSRALLFYYDADNLLTSVEAAGLPDENNPNVTVTRSFLRLHYKTLSLSTAFASPLVAKARETQPKVIDAIYTPGTGDGYWFGDADSYHPYGMLQKVVAQRGMSLSASSNTVQGTVTPGTMTRQAVYNFPSAPVGGYTDAPTFNSLNETWQSMDVASPYVTQFLVEEEATPRKVTTTVPGRTKRVQTSYNYSTLADTHPDKFKDGLTYLEEVYDISGSTEKLLLSSEVIGWDLGDYNAPRPAKIKKTDSGGRTTITEYQYGLHYNQVENVLEYGYDGVLIRKTHRTYHNESEYTLGSGLDQPIGATVVRPRVLNLIDREEVFDAANTRIGLTDYAYDEGTPENASGVAQHNGFFNPYAGLTNWVRYRGNVTSVTRYANPAAGTGAITETTGYDMTGNVRRASTSCCEETSYDYTLATQYAYPTTTNRGSTSTSSTLRMQVSKTYDFNTGLMLTDTDANGRTTQTKYYPTDWRLKKSTGSTGVRIERTYDDTNLSSTVQTYSSAGVLVGQSTDRLNGLGKVRRKEVLGPNGTDVTEIKYDALGRMWQQTRPFRDGQGPKIIETLYDAGGRVIKSTAADGSVAENFFDEATRPSGASSAGVVPGVTVRVRDAWGRERWMLFDASGNLLEVAEPVPGGTGQVLNTTGVLITQYKYDSLNHLVEVRQPGENGQPDQLRKFAYDGLGRLVSQKLAEKDATLSDAGLFVATPNGAGHFVGGTWSDAFAYDARSNLVSHTDARGVKTEFSYDLPGTTTKDPLNRLFKVSYSTAGAGANQAPVLAAPDVNYTYKTKSSASATVDLTQVAQVVTTGVVTETLNYDTEGRVSYRTLAFDGRARTLTTEYAYDSAGRLERVTYPQQYGLTGDPTKAAVNSYDVAGRLTGLKVGGVDYASLMKYNESGQLTSLRVGAAGANQTQESYLYDDNTGLLTDQTVLRGPDNGAPATLMHLSYDYLRPGTGSGRTGQVTRILDRLNPARNRTFGYDALGRLKTATGGAGEWSQTYSYDRFGNRTGVAAAGSTSTTAPNAIDDARFFVRQQYLDFLNREPDPSGLNFWAQEITNCGSNAQCVQGKRVDVSRAFFLSIEFQQTGYYAYRFYRAAYNRQPRFNELQGDMRSIGSGVVVGNAGWDTLLENNKGAFAETFTGRGEFAGYNSMGNGQYVDTLIANTGVAYPAGSRDGWVNALNGGTKTRGRVLREVVETGAFAQGPEYNKAFVLMQYFGYLRRNPNDLPDTDYAGYNFWLGQLNQYNDQWNMVKAFIESPEYRARFQQAGLPAQTVGTDGLASLTYEPTTNRVTAFQYDAAGNLTRGQRADGVWLRYQYDAAGRLAKVKNDADQTLETYWYATGSQRVITQNGNESSQTFTFYVWDAGRVIAEYYESAAAPATLYWLKSYFYLDSRLLATTVPNGGGGDVAQFHHVAGHSTRLITSPSDGGVSLQATMPYGTQFGAESVGGGSNRPFTVYDRGPVTKLDYAVNRFYEAGQGRFTQPDPIGIKSSDLMNPQSLNLYGYCGGDPVNRMDPDGLNFFGSLFGAIGGGLGFLGMLFGGIFGPGIPTVAFNWNGRNVVTFSNGFKNVALFGIPVFVNGNFILSYGSLSQQRNWSEELDCGKPDKPTLGGPTLLKHYYDGSGDPVKMSVFQIQRAIPTPLMFPDIKALIDKGTDKPMVQYFPYRAQYSVQLPGYQGYYLGRVTFWASGMLNVYLTGHYQFYGTIGVMDDGFDFHGSTKSSSKRDIPHEIANDLGELVPGKNFQIIMEGSFGVAFEGRDNDIETSKCWRTGK